MAISGRARQAYGMYLSPKVKETLEPALEKLADALIILADLQLNPRFCITDCPEEVYLRLLWKHASENERALLAPLFGANVYQTNKFDPEKPWKPLRQFTYPKVNYDGPRGEWLRKGSAIIGHVMENEAQKTEAAIAQIILDEAVSLYDSNTEQSMAGLYEELANRIRNDAGVFGESLYQEQCRHLENCERIISTLHPETPAEALVDRNIIGISHAVALRAGAMVLARYSEVRVQDYIRNVLDTLDYLTSVPGCGDNTEHKLEKFLARPDIANKNLNLAAAEVVFNAVGFLSHGYKTQTIWHKWVDDHNQAILDGGGPKLFSPPERPSKTAKKPGKGPSNGK